MVAYRHLPDPQAFLGFPWHSRRPHSLIKRRLLSSYGGFAMRRCLFLLPLAAAVWAVPAVHCADPDVPDGFESVLRWSGKDLTGWTVTEGADIKHWGAEDGILYTDGKPGGGWLMTEKEYADFEIRLEYRVPPNGNSGVGLRSPLKGDPAYAGMEIQVLDDYGSDYKSLQPFQYTGSIYGVVPPAKRVTRRWGQWNQMHITAKGRQVIVEVNGTEVVNANLDDHKDQADKHPGLLREKGHIGLQSHTDRVEFRNITIKPL
jgi:hypothetical protein